jgi:hypothetical protein
MGFDVFKDFTKNNIINWLNDLVMFISSPRIFIKQITSREAEDLFSQYLFYFIIYTFSYLLTTNATDFNSLVRPSILDLFFCIPLVSLFMVSCKIASGNTYAKQLIVFVGTLYLIYSPLNLFLFTLYVTQENYIFLFLQSILTFIFLTYLIYGFCFMIPVNVRNKFKTFLLNLLLIGVGYLLLEQAAFNLNKGNITIGDHDEISQEYERFIKGVAYSSYVPLPINMMNGKQITKTYYGLVSIGVDSVFQMDPDSIRVFQRNTLNNITYIKSRLPSLKFYRNVECAQTLLEFNSLINSSLSKEYFRNTITAYDNQIFNNKVPGINLNKDLKLDPKFVIFYHDILSSNNTVIKLHTINEALVLAQNVSVFLSGYLLSGIFSRDSVVVQPEKFFRYN